MVMIKFLFMLSVILYFPSAEARGMPSFKAMDGGQQFVCKKCNMSQWQDKSNANWAGKYSCTSCGAELN